MNIILVGLQKAFDVTLNVDYRGLSQRAHIYEYRGPKCEHSDYYKCTLIATLYHLNSLW